MPAIVLLVVISLTWLFGPTIATGVTPSCTIGLSGTAATITIQAWSANNDCNDIVNGRVSFLGDPVKPGGVYLLTSAPTGAILCETDKQGRHLVVRDQGLNIIGSGECQLLTKP